MVISTCLQEYRIIVVFFQGNPLYMYQFTFLIYQICCIFIDGGIYYILCIRLLNNNINHMLQIEKKSDYLICFEFWKDTFLYFCILRWSLKEPDDRFSLKLCKYTRVGI